jgi:hypothetical protein
VLGPDPALAGTIADRPVAAPLRRAA